MQCESPRFARAVRDSCAEGWPFCIHRFLLVGFSHSFRFDLFPLQLQGFPCCAQKCKRQRCPCVVPVVCLSACDHCLAGGAREVLHLGFYFWKRSGSRARACWTGQCVGWAGCAGEKQGLGCPELGWSRASLGKHSHAGPGPPQSGLVAKTRAGHIALVRGPSPNETHFGFSGRRSDASVRRPVQENPHTQACRLSPGSERPEALSEGSSRASGANLALWALGFRRTSVP